MMNSSRSPIWSLQSTIIINRFHTLLSAEQCCPCPESCLVGTFLGGKHLPQCTTFWWYTLGWSSHSLSDCGGRGTGIIKGRSGIWQQLPKAWATTGTGTSTAGWNVESMLHKKLNYIIQYPEMFQIFMNTKNCIIFSTYLHKENHCNYDFYSLYLVG